MRHDGCAQDTTSLIKAFRFDQRRRWKITPEHFANPNTLDQAELIAKADNHTEHQKCHEEQPAPKVTLLSRLGTSAAHSLRRRQGTRLACSWRRRRNAGAPSGQSRRAGGCTGGAAAVRW